MKLLMVVPFLLLVGCVDEKQAEFYRLAKANPDKDVCFNIHKPEELVGRYCTYYKGLRK